jgi:hypothetical protein
MYDNGVMAVGPQETVFAPRFGRVVAVLVAVVCLVTEVSLVSYGHLDALLRGTPAIALFGFGIWTLFWTPLLRLGPARLEVVNPLRTHTVPWNEIREISTRWSLALETSAGSISAWASPAQSPWGAVGRLHRDALGRPSLGPAERNATTSASGLVHRYWEGYRDDTAAGAAVTTRWHSATIVVLLVLLVLTITGIAWN